MLTKHNIVRTHRKAKCFLANHTNARRPVREHMTTAEKILDTIDNLASKFKSAYEDVDINDNMEVYRPVRAIMDAYDEIKKIWEDALDAYVRNKAAEDTAGKKYPPRTAARGIWRLSIRSFRKRK